MAIEQCHDFAHRQSERNVVAHCMMRKQAKQPFAGVLHVHQVRSQQRRMTQIQTYAVWVREGRQLIHGHLEIGLGRMLGARQCCVPANHLKRLLHALPVQRSAQDVMTIDHLLERIQECIDSCAVCEGDDCPQ
ncbi:hypothetical protein DyAD56_13245 [Dyella sp. AD56]|nr:hypothetical protein DyAD56_13245 [Dyella sp. AD56]